MDETLLNRLERKIDSLRLLVSKFNTESILGSIAKDVSIVSSSSKSIFLDTDLSSPYKQYLYLAGLLLSTEQIGEKSLDEYNFKRMKKLLQDIVNIYSLMFFPTTQQLESGLCEKWYETRSISMPVFLTYFNTISLSYQEQQIERIHKWFSPFNKYFKEAFNFTAENLVEIYLYIGKHLQKQLNDLQLYAQEFNKERFEFVENVKKNNMSIEEASALINKSKIEAFLKHLELIFHISIKQLNKEFGESVIQNFLDFFTMTRKTKEFRYYTEKNPCEIAPIWRKSDEYIFCPFYKQIINAIYEFLYRSLEDSKLANSFYKKRDLESERQTREIFKKLFSEEAKYYSSIFETPNSQNEHDLLIEYRDVLIIVEIKASKIKEPFRDPDKAYTRIKRDFQSDKGVQKAFDQGLRLKNILLRNKVTNLYDKEGHIIATIDSSNFREVYLICVTADNMGALGSQLSLLLEKPDDELYPWSCNLYDLDSIVEAFIHMKLNADNFLNYLDSRALLHEKFFAVDELEICGYYLEKGNFDDIEASKGDLYFFSPEMSGIFDKIYFEKHGIDLGFLNSDPGLFKFSNFVDKPLIKEQASKTKKSKRKEKMIKASKKQNRKKKR